MLHFNEIYYKPKKGKNPVTWRPNLERLTIAQNKRSIYGNLNAFGYRNTLVIDNITPKGKFHKYVTFITQNGLTEPLVSTVTF